MVTLLKPCGHLFQVVKQDLQVKVGDSAVFQILVLVQAGWADFSVELKGDIGK